ncbi:MAG: cbb3-type cytochrome c oxidase subunit I [Spirochaetota bacterium]|nr:cbb3-type cytochrome c oxidase subunit I [Spirochaetota bacterium]
MSAISHAGSHHDVGFIRKYIFSTDHKVIGMQYLITGLIMAFVGGYLAYVFRYKLGFGQGLEHMNSFPVPLYGELTPEKYNGLITLHGMIMIFWVAMPILLAAFGNFLVPTMVGCDDMAYPTLNMLSYWVFLLSTIVLLVSFLGKGGAYGGGWTLYPPLSGSMAGGAGGGYSAAGDFPGIFSGGSLLIIAVALEFIAFLMGGLNFIVTTLNMRAPGMKIWDVPLFVWLLNLAVVDFMFSVGPLVAGAVMLLLDRIVGTRFYDHLSGGDPILFQHLFWFFGHPEVYVLLLPSIGIIGEIIPAFSRKPIFGYKLIIYSAIIASGLSFIVWAHHQFVSGIDPRMATFFSLTTIAISIPFAAIMFSLIATLWGGSIQFKTPMLWAMGWLATFLVGGVTGIYLGSSAFDIPAHDTYFVVAHFHYTLIPITFFGGLAAIYFWYPKFVGKMYNETMGKLHFWLTMIFYNLTIFPLFIPGMAGQHRRIFDYSLFESMGQYQGIRAFSSIMLICLLCTQVIFVLNMIISAVKGKKAEKNPWKANSLEWVADSPPPHGNFATYPTVYRGPYEYSVPGRDSDYWPQNEPN